MAQALIAARSTGWKVPVYTPPAGEDPLVRQELAGHPSWVDGLTFASGRMTAEKGPGPFLSFQAALTQQFGAQQVGVKTSDGRPVTQPPDYAMYPFDFVRLVATALRAARSSTPDAVTSALDQVSIEGANGDHRGFNEKNHEGVVDDDVDFARFAGHDLRASQGRRAIGDPADDSAGGLDPRRGGERSTRAGRGVSGRRRDRGRADRSPFTDRSRSAPSSARAGRGSPDRE